MLASVSWAGANSAKLNYSTIKRGAPPLGGRTGGRGGGCERSELQAAAGVSTHGR